MVGRQHLIHCCDQNLLHILSCNCRERQLAEILAQQGFGNCLPIQRLMQGGNGRKRFRGDMDVEIVVDMLEMAEHADHLVLFSGDGDFRKLVEAVQRKGARVTVVSTVKSQPPMVSDDLRRQADSFVDLADLADLIGRPSRLPRFISETRGQTNEREDADG